VITLLEELAGYRRRHEGHGRPAGTRFAGRSPLIKIRRVRKGDLSKVRDVIEQSFADFFERQMGTRPRQVFGGAQYVHHRWLMEPWAASSPRKVMARSWAPRWR